MDRTLRPVDLDEDGCVNEDLVPAPAATPDGLHYELALTTAWADASRAARKARDTSQTDEARIQQAVANALADVGRKARWLADES